MSRSIDPEISPCSGLSLAPTNERDDTLRRVLAELAPQNGRNLALADERPSDLLVVQGADLFQRVRERIVPDVVQQRRHANQHALVATERRVVLVLLEQRQRATGEVIRAQGVLEARMSCAGIDEEGQPELANVSEPLESRRIDQLEGERIEADVVPERIANDLDGHDGG